MSASQDGRPRIDGVWLAVLANRFEAIVRSMMNTLMRTARSGVINVARDFSCCVLTGDDELVAMAESIPTHVMRGPDLMTKTMKEFHPDLRPGDAFLHNSPYHGNTHAADYSILVPVIDGSGVHRFTAFAKAHQADCGNALPTTYSASARDVYEEGALIFACVKVQDDYCDIEDVIRMCRTRIRVPEQWWGDYLALLGGARIGERRLLELGAEVGWDVLAEYTREWFDYSERRMVAAIRKLPARRVMARTAHDPIAEVPEGIPITVTVEAKPDEAVLEVDLRDNVDCQPCGLNLSEATSYTGAMLGVFNGIGHDVPPNSGSFRPLRIHLRENCVCGIPRHPTSCSVATTNVFDRVANAVQRALAELVDGAGMAECGLSFPASVSVISGNDPRLDGAPFVNQIILAWTGGAAGPYEDGWLNAGGVGDGGVLLRDSVEIDEIKHPIRIHAQRIVPDSEGAGRFRGAPAALLEYGPVDTTMEAAYISDGTVNPALGARGGLAGAPARQYRRDVSGALHELPVSAVVEIGRAETIVSISCGGGGYGPPLERDSERVRREVAEGWITRERAEEVYGVVLDAAGAVDRAATAERRAAIASPTVKAASG